MFPCFFSLEDPNYLDASDIEFMQSLCTFRQGLAKA